MLKDKVIWQEYLLLILLILVGAGIIIIVTMLPYMSISTTALTSTISIIAINNQSYNIALATTPQAQAQGLMDLSVQELESKGIIGMLFIFNNNGPQCFWMKNTEIPLEQAWIENGTIVALYNATPYSLKSICHTGNEVLEIPNALNITLSIGDKVVLTSR
ncbi:MAG: DUF192 domain-containing protein [Candidatus Micrarchaeaceae archaeon]